MGKVRTYDINECVVFWKVSDRFGKFSNMAEMKIKVNDYWLLGSEALYQMARFPHLIDHQKYIARAPNLLLSKRYAYERLGETRDDWDLIKIQVMRWVLRVKMAAHWSEMQDLLLKTGDLPIVERSSRDPWWGTLMGDDGITLSGENILGRLIMEMRAEFKSTERASLLVALPPTFPMLIFGEEVREVTAFNQG